jgi:hypothetical protein
MKKIIMTLILSSSLFSNDPGLFAKVVNVSTNDTLNVRVLPNYKAEKVAEIPYDWYVGVEKCKKIDHSTWCRVYPLLQQWSEHFGAKNKGWVNARYLQFENSGFVTIEGKKNNCYYALKCQKGTCLVIVGMKDDPQTDKVIDFETQWIERSKLRGESGFGAASNEMDGYCTTGNWLKQYLQENSGPVQQLKHAGSEYVVHQLLEAMESQNLLQQIAVLIHQVQGLTLSDMVHFGDKNDHHFTKASYLEEMHSSRKLFWGHTYGKGDAIDKTLQEYMNALHRERKAVTKIVSLKDLKSFSKKGHSDLKAYEVYWIDENSEVKEYSYLGLVVILEAYHGQWYIVGLLRDRWTI